MADDARPKKRQSTLDVFLPKKPKHNAENIDHSDSDEPSTSSRCFQSKWLSLFSWLEYDKSIDSMTCAACKQHDKKNVFTSGTKNFRTSTLTRHARTLDHKSATETEKLQEDFKVTMRKAVSDKEEAICVGLQTVYWLSKEAMPLHKYNSMMKLLSDLKCPHVDKLRTGKSTYCSETMANDMVQCLSSVVKGKINSSLESSPCVSLLIDESTDISVEKKLIVYTRIIDPVTFKASTHFVTNVQIDNGSGATIFEALSNVLASRGIPWSKIMGLGSDGAAVMTGRGEGVTGHVLRRNPMVINYHCIAHKLALVSSQAAARVPALKAYNETLTGMFYYFRSSANRCHGLVQVQKLLDQPELKIKEVHEVRWLAIFKAVETVYKCLDSLITFFRNQKDDKAQGYVKKLIQKDFVSCTYLLMDVLSVLTELCLTFQKQDLDIAYVQVSVEKCMSALEDIRSGTTSKPSYMGKHAEDVLFEDDKCVLKGNHILQGRSNITSIREAFLKQVIENLNNRFPPESSMVYAFGVLSMRPVSVLTQKDLKDWGNEKMEVLINHFGQVQSHKYKGETVSRDPIINPNATREEWSKVKCLVVNAGYPTDKMQTLWSLIYKHHKEDFQNLTVLASLALTAPIHTADCERGFSAQNHVKTSLRNRLSDERLDDLITVNLEGAESEDFDFHEAFIKWSNKKNRNILS